MFPEWDGAFLVGGLVAEAVVVLHMNNHRVVAEEWVPVGARVRDVRVAPNGSVVVITEQRGQGSEIVQFTGTPLRVVQMSGADGFRQKLPICYPARKETPSEQLSN